MPISEVAVENFTAFDELSLNFSKGINVFIGDNGTGKTHLLKFLYAFCESKRIENGGALKDVFFALLYDFFDMKDNYFWIRHPKKKYAFEAKLFDGSVCCIKGDCSSDSAAYNQMAENLDSAMIHHENINDLNKFKSAFIPAKEMLTHSRIEKDYAHRKLPLDRTLIDIINNASISSLRHIPDDSREMMTEIEKIIGGSVTYKNDTYYILRGGSKYNFRVEAEGHKKFALLSRLIEGGVLRKGSMLFWDEPESNINPKNVPKLVDILLALQTAGVQVFLATHDYLLPKYLELRRKETDDVQFHLFSRASFKKPVTVSSDTAFSAFENNYIINQPIELYKETIKRGMD